MEFELKNWLSSTGRSQDVLHTIDEITQFSKGLYAPFFQNCGIYAVGSSLNKKIPNDIDLVLVGLDFRAVAEYDKIFLQDPETLISEEIVIKPSLARKKGVTNPFSFRINSNSAQSLWNPLPENPKEKIKLKQANGLEGEIVEPDKLEDLDPVSKFMLNGIEHKGEYWAYNFQKGMLFGVALSLSNYCLSHGGASRLVNDLHKNIASAFGKNTDSWDLVTPFEPYFHQEESFLTFRFSIHEYECPANKKYVDECLCRPIDLIIHAENLHLKYWKQHQNKLNYPYACLHEWPKTKNVFERPILTNLSYPEFIDPKGRERVKPYEYFFDFLRDASINV